LRHLLLWDSDYCTTTISLITALLRVREEPSNTSHR
jgi:hypothetical protein